MEDIQVNKRHGLASLCLTGDNDTQPFPKERGAHHERLHRARDLCVRAQEAMQEEEIEEALELTESALRSAPRFVPALLMKAQIHLFHEEPSEALEAAEDAEAAATDQWREDDLVIARITAMRGYATLELGRFFEAILMLREALLRVEHARPCTSI